MVDLLGCDPEDILLVSAKEGLGIPELLLANAVDNVASGRIKARSGAVRTGEIELALHHSSRVETWRLTREAWAAARGPK